MTRIMAPTSHSFMIDRPQTPYVSRRRSIGAVINEQPTARQLANAAPQPRLGSLTEQQMKYNRWLATESLE